MEEEQQNENEIQNEENTNEEQEQQQQQENEEEDEQQQQNEPEEEAEQGPLDPTTVMTNTDYTPSSSIPVENVSHHIYIYIYIYIVSPICLWSNVTRRHKKICLLQSRR